MPAEYSLDGYPIIVIDLSEERYWDNCPMCDQFRRLDHAVAWCCGPTHDEIGTQSTEYRDSAVGGMCVCKACHDGHHGVAA